MTGRLQYRVSGRPVNVVADGSGVIVKVANLRSAWLLRTNLSTVAEPLTQILRKRGIALRLQIGNRLKLKVLPSPSPIVRLLLFNTS